jgi:DNA mismatch repair protein MutL
MNRIAILPPAVQGQIAAGEVIERPASVVKELVENAIDAGASHIEVHLDGGGVSRLVVTDDGCGMPADDAVLAFARHATSKLTRTEDLQRVGTFGFRGEALPSIAAAGRVRLTTRAADMAGAAVVEASDAGARLVGPGSRAPGTTVEVSDLFGSTPARRKFLRQPATELGHTADVLTRLAVACPRVGVRLSHERREVLAFPPVDGLRQRLVQVLGATRAAGLIEVEGQGGDVAVSGLVAPPRDHLSSARLLWTYAVIGDEDARPRWVRDRLLLRAVLDGYESVLVRGRYPIAFLVLRFTPGSLDVNVHPAKLEVRFREAQAVHRVVSSAVRSRLREGLRVGAVQRQTDGAWAVHEATPGTDIPSTDTAAAAPGRSRVIVPLGGPGAGATPSARVFDQRTLWTAAPSGFRGLRFVAQIFDGYLLCDAGDHLVLIDQHAAHERVLFERLQTEHHNAEVARDPLLVPEVIPLARTEAALLGEHGTALAAVGLEGEPFGDDAFLLRTLPRAVRGRDVGTLLKQVAADLADAGVTRVVERSRDALLATLACHAATRVGDRLDAQEVRALLAAMDGVAVNAHCPHGRPVAVQLRRPQVEALFGR